METQNQIESRLSRMEGEFEQLVSTVSSLAQSTTTFQRDIGSKIDALSKATHPNLGLLVKALSVVVTIIGLIGGIIAFHYNSRISDNERHFESRLADAVELFGNEHKWMVEARKLVDADITRRIEAVETELRDTQKADLEELRKYRNLNVTIPQTKP